MEIVMENKTLRVGIIGLGRISAVHISGLQNAKDAEIVAVCDIDEGKLKDAATAFRSLRNTDLPTTVI